MVDVLKGLPQEVAEIIEYKEWSIKSAEGVGMFVERKGRVLPLGALMRNWFSKALSLPLKNSMTRFLRELIRMSRRWYCRALSTKRRRSTNRAVGSPEH